MNTLSIIGCGKVGTALAYAWSERSVFLLQDILNSTPNSARLAVKRLNAGRAVAQISDLQTADMFMIAAPDDQLRRLCEELSAAAVLREGDIVFHCSGALSSSELVSARKVGAKVASVHPVKSFVESDSKPDSFEGTYFAMEGDTSAIEVLKPAIEIVEGQFFDISAESKLIYHAASVFACNYLTALMEVSVQAYEKAGLDREMAMQIMQPLVNQTVENIFKNGPSQALTGPIVRGDVDIITKQLKAVSAWNPEYGELYNSLGSVATVLAKKQNQGRQGDINAIAKLFEKD